MRFRYGLRSIFLFTTSVTFLLVAGLHVYWQHFTPYGAYQSHKDGASLMIILRDDLRNGVGRVYVTELLGQGTVINNASDLEAIRESIKRKPSAYPDGLQDTDVFVAYVAAEGFGLRLQFRDDKLVNFK